MFTGVCVLYLSICILVVLSVRDKLLYKRTKNNQLLKPDKVDDVTAALEPCHGSEVKYHGQGVPLRYCYRLDP